MSTTRDQLGKQAIEVTEDLREMGNIARDGAVQEKVGQVRENVSEYYQQGRDHVHDLACSVEQFHRKRPFQSKRFNAICKKCRAVLPRRSARRPRRYAAMHSTLPRAWSIRRSKLPARPAPALTTRNVSSAIGRESRCLVCFGVGLIAGVVIALSLRSR